MAKRNISPSMAIIVNEDDDFNLSLSRLDREDEDLGLYMVSWTVTQATFVPRSGVAFVLAESEQAAIDQAECAARPGVEDRYSGTAARVPFLMRGWSGRTF